MANRSYYDSLLIIIFLLATAPLLRAGNDLKPTRGGDYSRISSKEQKPLITVSKRPQNLGAVIKARQDIWKNTSITKEQRHEKILELYFEALALLKKAENFIDLLKDTAHLAPTSDEFMLQYAEHFIATRPAFEQIMSFDDMEIRTVIAIKKSGLKLVQKPDDFLRLVAISENAAAPYKEQITDFIHENLAAYKATKPSIEDIALIQAYLFKLQKQPERTAAVLIALKRNFFDHFADEALLELLDYGCDTPSEIYKEQLASLISEYPFLDSKMPIYRRMAEMIAARERVWKKTELPKKERLRIIAHIYVRALPLFQAPEDFIALFDKKDLNKAAEKFLASHLDNFFALKPTLEQTIKLDVLCPNADLVMLIKTGGLKLVRSPADFLKLTDPNAENPFPIYKTALTDFIGENLSTFANTLPTLDQVMALQKRIFDLQVNEDKTVSVLIKLKEAFIGRFIGVDLIRLLDFGCEKPCAIYERQLGSLKKMHSIEF